MYFIDIPTGNNGWVLQKKQFCEVNSDPNTLYKVDPADQFLAAAAGCQDDFEYYYDVYRALNYWMQYSTNQTGNALGFMNPSSNFNERYGKVFYGRVGTYLSDIPHLISNMSQDEQAKRLYQQSIAAIFKAYYAFYVSDINGSIPYSKLSRPDMVEHKTRNTTGSRIYLIRWICRSKMR